MPRKRTKAAKQAQGLLVWLETLELPARVINALRRDLEVITGEREGEEGGGVLTGFDQAQFTEELYRPRGGQISKVPSVAASAIETLRAAIPAPVSSDTIESPQPAQSDEPTDVVQEDAKEGQGGELTDATPEGVVPTQELADAADGAGTPADAHQEPRADAASNPVVEAAEPPAGVAPEAGVESVDAPAAPKRRGRPPRAPAAAASASEPVEVEAPAAPAKRGGRPPRDGANAEAAAFLPNRTRRARVAAARDAAQQVPALAMSPAEVAAPVLAAPTALPVADPSFDVLLRLWRELHPQGQRAAMHFMESLAGEG